MHKYEFSGRREDVIIRDKGRCVKCGMTREEHYEKFGRDITVDHIDGTGCNTPASRKNNSMDNLQTLCLPCHGRKDGPRRTKYNLIPFSTVFFDKSKNRWRAYYRNKYIGVYRSKAEAENAILRRIATR